MKTESAGKIPPSNTRYVVVDAHDHKTIRAGNIVVMTETPRLENYLLRESDMTLHDLEDGGEQYVHLAVYDGGQIFGTGTRIPGT